LLRARDDVGVRLPHATGHWSSVAAAHVEAARRAEPTCACRRTARSTTS